MVSGLHVPRPLRPKPQAVLELPASKHTSGPPETRRGPAGDGTPGLRFPPPGVRSERPLRRQGEQALARAVGGGGQAVRAAWGSPPRRDADAQAAPGPREGMRGFRRSARPSSLEPASREGLTLLRSSSCCCSNSGTAAMATRALSGGRLAERGKKRLGRGCRLGGAQGRLRPRLRRPPCRTAAGALGTPPPSQKPWEERAGRHVLPQSCLPRTRCRPSWSRARKLCRAYPGSGPRGHR